MVALIGLLGILLGEEIAPIAKRWVSREAITTDVKSGCVEHATGRPPKCDRKPSAGE